jgi:hypothetical protein
LQGTTPKTKIAVAARCTMFVTRPNVFVMKPSNKDFINDPLQYHLIHLLHGWSYMGLIPWSVFVALNQSMPFLHSTTRTICVTHTIPSNDSGTFRLCMEFINICLDSGYDLVEEREYKKWANKLSTLVFQGVVAHVMACHSMALPAISPLFALL